MELGAKVVGLTIDGNNEDAKSAISFLLSDGEQVLKSYKSIRDRVIFTTTNIIIVNVQGITGKKKEYLVVPLSKVNVYAVETAGTMDLDAEFKVWVSGFGKLELQFLRGTNVQQIASYLNKYIN